jgi:hypothetical protein
MVEVNDLEEFVWPVWAPIRVILAQPARRRLAPRQHGCNWCEEVAPVKACREPIRLPFDVPAARLSLGPSLDQLE